MAALKIFSISPEQIFGPEQDGRTPMDATLHETRTVPIVFAVVSDPIGSGFAASLAHPGSNITGFRGTDPALGGKWVELVNFTNRRDTLEWIIIGL
jgi:putative tryptophan/tyrosine transport system substrate-binding protein